MGRLIDLTGRKFGKLSVIRRSGAAKDGEATWLCQCECGAQTVVDGKSLRTGNTRTCGCSRKQPRPYEKKHGDCKTRLYRIWGNMKHRCYGKSDAEKYQYYGGRGITVCDEWHDFINFRKWALKSGYNDSLTLDRIDNDGNYSPDNCRWVPVKRQCMNRRSNHFITENGKTLSVLQWANLLGVSHSTIISRLKKGGSIYGRKDTLAPLI